MAPMRTPPAPAVAVARAVMPDVPGTTLPLTTSSAAVIVGRPKIGEKDNASAVTIGLAVALDDATPSEPPPLMATPSALDLAKGTACAVIDTTSVACSLLEALARVVTVGLDRAVAPAPAAAPAVPPARPVASTHAVVVARLPRVIDRPETVPSTIVDTLPWAVAKPRAAPMATMPPATPYVSALASLVSVEPTRTVPFGAVTVVRMPTWATSVGVNVVRTSVPAPAPPKAMVTAVATPRDLSVVSSARASIVTPPPEELTLPPDTAAVMLLVSVLSIRETPIDPPILPNATATAVTRASNTAVCSALIARSPPAVITAPVAPAATVLATVLNASAPPAATETSPETATAAALATALTSLVVVAAIESGPRARRVPPLTMLVTSSRISFLARATPTATAAPAGARVTAATAPMTCTASVSLALAEIVTPPSPIEAVPGCVFTLESVTNVLTLLVTSLLATPPTAAIDTANPPPEIAAAAATPSDLRDDVSDATIDRPPATSTVEFAMPAWTVLPSVLTASMPAPARATPTVLPKPTASDAAHAVAESVARLSARSEMSPVVAVTPAFALRIDASMVLATLFSAWPTPIDTDTPTPEPPNAAAIARAPVHAEATEVSVAASTTSLASMPMPMLPAAVPLPSIVAATSVATLLSTRAPAPPRLTAKSLEDFEPATEPANATASIVAALMAVCVSFPLARMLVLETVAFTSAGRLSPEAV